MKKGDRVKLTSKTYCDSQSDPLWNGNFGRVTGTIIEKNIAAPTGIPNIRVRWDNGRENSYRFTDLEFLTEDDKIPPISSDKLARIGIKVDYENNN